MKYLYFHELIRGYLGYLKGRASYPHSVRIASQWLIHRPTTPTRKEFMDRHEAKGVGDFKPCSVQANKELALARAACRWGMYRELWDGGDPTAGIKKWKTRKRTKICKFQEVRAILHAFDFVPTIETAPIAREADSWTGLLAIRDRALIGIELFTGCRPVEIRTAPLSAITAYGLMGCWHKGKTKNGEDQELPIPAQAMHWLAEWLKVRSLFDPWGTNPYLFPGQNCNTPLTDSAIRRRWAALRTDLGIDVRLWNYDLRRTLSSYLGNELKYDDKTIQAILNHYDGRAISHYYHVSFDALTVVIQHYADWLWAFKQEAPCSVVGSSFSASSQGAGVTRHSSPLLAALPPLVHLR